MADKIVIEVFKEKTAEDFTTALSSPDCRANAGSAAAYTAAMAYIVRNCEILRGYMVHLIDEDVKSKRPFARAQKEGGPREIEATIQTASCIDAEIVNMMKPCLEFLEELCPLCPADDRHFIREAAELAISAKLMGKGWICRLSTGVAP